MTQPKPNNPDLRELLLDAALMHVPFDGWSPETFSAAVSEARIDPATAKAVCPRGAVDLAIAYHERGDEEMLARIAEADFTQMRFRDRVTAAIQFRVEAAEDKEIVRRGSTLFALPPYATDGARLIWGTADKIWTALGDTSDDFNWYSKRTILSGVYSATILYWLGDESEDNHETWAFLDRRIENVMQFEKFKGSRTFKTIFGLPMGLLSNLKAPHQDKAGWPGH